MFGYINAGKSIRVSFLKNFLETFSNWVGWYLCHHWFRSEI